jgi:undecaprenyl phosphate N,N'-diacetylbacillosamine 1-phosphate transferase
MWLSTKRKRCFDLACVFAGIFVFGWLCVLIALAIFLDERKELFFRQRRIGRGGREFEVFKFRTMTDGQITRAGYWLRKSGLDELPQLLNVLAGDMSIVGPRPLTSDDIVRLGWTCEDWRWLAKPGITGLAQIRAGDGAAASLNSDREYIEGSAFLIDAEVVGITFLMNVFGKRRVQRVLSRPNRRSVS